MEEGGLLAVNGSLLSLVLNSVAVNGSLLSLILNLVAVNLASVLIALKKLVKHFIKIALGNSNQLSKYCMKVHVLYDDPCDTMKTE